MDEKPPAARKKNRDNMHLFLSAPSSEERIEKIRAKLGAPISPVAEELPEWTLASALPEEKAERLRAEVRTLINDYKLPENYEPYLQYYILYDRMDAPQNNFAVVPFSRDTDVNESRHVTVHIYAHLTKREEAELRRELKRVGKGVLPAFEALKDVKLKIDRERQRREVEDWNKKSGSKRRQTYAEALNKSPERARQASEYKREMERHRIKRFGRN